ncbi:hypothetical protein AXG93_2145s1530 [Marchantia polymorpha subsp. ruderalis]|uniref:Reverse transcriptase domain-containing protein n=1 Tax=Marchantia polymorpha subsp. ruderalis TaxID=1480154 RepID=A0A176VYH7_MARPO|nr:hypothetical protein AXG93_2145s1530 [Marchantia polymorpha subsp. ruderalis]
MEAERNHPLPGSELVTNNMPLAPTGGALGDEIEQVVPPRESPLGSQLQGAPSSEEPKSMNRSQATMEDSLDSSEDETSNVDPEENFSDDEALEDKQADPETEEDLDLEETLNMLRQVTLVITKDDTQKKQEESENLTAVLCFLDRGLSTPQVQEWAEEVLSRGKKLKIISITAIGSRNYHIRFHSQRDRDLALSRTRITYLQQDFIIVKWTSEAEDLSYTPAMYPVWEAQQAYPDNGKGKWRTDTPTFKTPAPTSKFFQQLRTKGRSDGYWRKLTPQQAALIDNQADHAGEEEETLGARPTSEDNACNKQRGDAQQEIAQAKRTEVEENNTATSPAPQTRKKRATPRGNVENAVGVQAQEAGSKRKTVTEREPIRGRAKMAKSGSPIAGPQKDVVALGDQKTQSLSPLQPKQLLQALAQQDNVEGTRAPNPISGQALEGAEEPARQKEGYEETVPVALLEPQPLTEGIRAKFTSKKELSQDHTTPLGAKKLSMKSSAIRKREMRAAKSAARAVGGNQISRRGKTKDVDTISLSTDVLAIQEHKLDRFAMTAIGHLLSRELQTICAPCQKGARGEGTGGTALLIHRSIKIRASGTSEDGYVTWAQVEKGGHEWHIASVYGPHSPRARAEHWTKLRNLFPYTNVILCGDLNMVENPLDSSGERKVLGGAEELTFTELRTKHNLHDLRGVVAEARGPLHTRWSAYGGDPRWARLDRIYCSHGGRWLAAAHYLQHHAGNTLSDHLPVIASVDIGTVVCADGRLSLAGPTKFKWNPSLLGKPQIQEIANLHSSSTPAKLTVQQLVRLDWLETEKRIREHERDVEIRLWSRVKHLGLEDAPSKYFFNIHRQNATRAQILQLQLPIGEVTRDQSTIMCTGGQYYAELYTAQAPSTADILTRQELMDRVADHLTDAERSMLSALPSEKEIEDVLFSLRHNKAPGVDGISAEAMKRTWPLMKDFYVRMVGTFWEKGVLAETVTEGMIRLIPKSVNKMALKDWRPLTMLTTDYKIIARILEGRLQLLLQKIISPQQTGFIKGWHMLDNVLTLWIAQDAARTYKHKGMFVKLDFEKAYDRVEHNYLWDAMSKCGLGSGFITLVKGLTLGASTAVHVNGAKTYRFPVGRGVRQGCPLAPLLFVLATQPLMTEMEQSFQAGRLRGYKVGDPVLLDYSLFADDMGVFIDNTHSFFQELRRVLAKYEVSSGARLNLSKSSILLLGMDRPPDWFALTGCALMQRGEIHKYLGAQAGLDLSKQQQNDFCVQKILNTLGGWELRLLSFEARAVLLQFVLQAQPTFYSSLIKLSATTCRKIEQLYRQFLWGYNKDGEAKRSLVRWDLVCRPKAEGGLGIRCLPDTNSSLMGKWIGSILDETAGTWGLALADLVK